MATCEQVATVRGEEPSWVRPNVVRFVPLTDNSTWMGPPDRSFMPRRSGRRASAAKRVDVDSPELKAVAVWKVTTDQGAIGRPASDTSPGSRRPERRR